MRLSGRTVLLLATLMGLVAVIATDQILPGDTEYRSQMRVWLVARASWRSRASRWTGTVR